MRVASLNESHLTLVRGLDGSDVTTHTPVSGGGNCTCSAAGVASGVASENLVRLNPKPVPMKLNADL